MCKSDPHIKQENQIHTSSKEIRFTNQEKKNLQKKKNPLKLHRTTTSTLCLWWWPPLLMPNSPPGSSTKERILLKFLITWVGEQLWWWLMRMTTLSLLENLTSWCYHGRLNIEVYWPFCGTILGVLFIQPLNTITFSFFLW